MYPVQVCTCVLHTCIFACARTRIHLSLLIGMWPLVRMHACMHAYVGQSGRFWISNLQISVASSFGWHHALPFPRGRSPGAPNHTLSHPKTQTHTHTHPHARTHTHTHVHALSVSYSLSHETHTRTHADTPKRSLTHAHTQHTITQAGWSYPLDVWAIGCLICELCIGTHVFELAHDDVHILKSTRYSDLV